MMKSNPKLTPKEYFHSPNCIRHRQYLAMRDFFRGNKTASEVAAEHGYTVSTVYAMARDLKKHLKDGVDDPFFRPVKIGRPELDKDGTIQSFIVALRKNYLSVPEIKSFLEAADTHVSLAYIQSILQEEGFARLPRRDTETK